MRVNRPPSEAELAEQRELLKQHDAALAGMETLAGGSAITDEIQAEAEERATHDPSLLEAQAAELKRLRRDLEETQEFIRRLTEAGQTTGQISQAAVAEERRRVNDALIRSLVARGGRVTVLIHPSPNQNENWPVSVGINGESIKIKRGVPTEIPVEYLGTLNDARRQDVEPLLDANENPIPGGHIVDRHSYPFSVLPGAQPEERIGRSFSGPDVELARGANQPRVNP